MTKATTAGSRSWLLPQETLSGAARSDLFFTGLLLERVGEFLRRCCSAVHGSDLVDLKAEFFHLVRHVDRCGLSRTDGIVLERGKEEIALEQDTLLRKIGDQHVLCMRIADVVDLDRLVAAAEYTLGALQGFQLQLLR